MGYPWQILLSDVLYQTLWKSQEISDSLEYNGDVKNSIFLDVSNRTMWILYNVMNTRKRIGISIPTEIYDAIERIRTKSNRSQFILELIRPELERRVSANVWPSYFFMLTQAGSQIGVFMHENRKLCFGTMPKMQRIRIQWMSSKRGKDILNHHNIHTDHPTKSKFSLREQKIIITSTTAGRQNCLN